MGNKKNIFLIAAILFFIIMIVLGIDISSRTTFPGSKPQLKERIVDKVNDHPDDSLVMPVDSL